MLDIQRRRTRGFFALITLPATAMGFALSVQISVLSWILATRYHLDIEEIGLVWAAGPLAGILGQVVVGIVSDRIWIWNGRRRPFILVGGIVAALMILALPAIGAISHGLGFDSVIGVAVTVALALDLAINLSFNPTRALIADVTPEGPERSRGYGWMQTISGSFGVLAYAIGALFGNDTLIYAAVGIVLLLSVVPILLIEEPRALPPPLEAESGAGLRVIGLLSPLAAVLVYDVYAMGARLIGEAPAGRLPELLCAGATALLIAHALVTDQPFRRIIAAHAMSWIGVQSLFIYLVSFIQYRMPALDAAALGRVTALAYLALNGVAALAPALLLAPLAARYRRVHVHAAALAVMALAFAATWRFAHSPGVLFALMAMAGIGWGAIVSLPFAIMSERVESARIGLYMGLFNLAVVLPQLVASFAFGTWASGLHDKGAIFLLGAICLALSAVLWLFVSPRANTR
jgi:MFS family permease